MSNSFNIFRENDTDSGSDEENSQEENSTISTSQPGRELDEFNILNQQRRRVQQLDTTPIIGLNNQFTNQPITNNLEQQVTTMDATQFNQLITALGQLTQQLGNQQGGAGNTTAAASPRIAVQIPIFKGETKENVAAWLIQAETIFAAQGINDTAIRCYYASTGMKEAALHWYLARMTEHGNNAGVPWNDWNAFKTAVRAAFQPPNYQSYLRQQLRRLKQTGSVRDYTTQFQNVVGQIEGMGDLDQVAHYLDGLKPDTRKELAYQAPQSLEAAINLAVRYDSAMWGFGKPMNSNKSRTTSYNRPPPPSRDDGGPRPMDLDYIGESKNHNRTNYQRNKYSSNNNSNYGSSNNKGKSSKEGCYNCGKLGHFS